MKKNSGFSRRNFLKGIGVAATIPLMPSLSLGEEISNGYVGGASHKILTANIRVALKEDSALGFGWESRKELCIDIFKKHKPDIIGMQEVLRVQNEDLKKALPGYISFGFEGPEMDAFQDDDYHFVAKNPIFFSSNRYDLTAGGEYWLSETPLIGGSSSWDTARARHANYVRLKDKKTGEEFRFVNLHLDHKNQTAREKQMALVLQECAQYPKGFKQILTGDFNASMENPVHKAIREAGWKDSYAAIHGDKEAGYTVHLFKGENYENKAKGKKIDFIYTLGDFKATDAAIVTDSKDGRYPSDHYFVSAVLEF